MPRRTAACSQNADWLHPSFAQVTVSIRIRWSRAAEAATQAAEAARDAALLQRHSPAPGQPVIIINQVINAPASPVEAAWRELDEVLTTSGDIRPGDCELLIQLDPLTAPRPWPRSAWILRLVRATVPLGGEPRFRCW